MLYHSFAYCRNQEILLNVFCNWADFISNFQEQQNLVGSSICLSLAISFRYSKSKIKKQKMKNSKIPNGSPLDQHVDLNRYKNKQVSVLNLYYQANLLQILDRLPQQNKKDEQNDLISKTSINEAIGMADGDINQLQLVNIPTQINIHNVKKAFKHGQDPLGNDTFINDYVLSKNNSTLGKGSHSVVRLAKKGAESYAIKIISYERLKKRVIIKDQQITKMINSEISLLQKLKSQYIIGFIQAIYSAQKQRVFIVLEYCSNGALTRTIYRSPAVPLKQWQQKAKKYMYQIALGIRIMHSNNIIHRDIKSDNVLINQKDQVRLIDFNVSCEIPSNGIITITDRFVGTKTYAPPELLIAPDKPREVNGKLIDIWALGVTYLEFLDRKHPFAVGEAADLLTLIKSPVKINPDFSADIRDLLQKMLKLQNRQRIHIEEVIKHPCFKQFNN